MNGKQAKSLRRMARALTPEAPWAAYVRRTRYRIVSITNPDGTKGKVTEPRIQTVLHEETGRALYQRFKQGYRRLARKEAAAIQLLQKIRQG